MKSKEFITSFIVPTGVGATVGGFAGDASPAVKLLSSISKVIANPNSVNAAVFSGINSNILYTEGFALDSFFKGEVALSPSKYNKIGVIFDSAIPDDVLSVHINTVNAVKNVYGLNLVGYIMTEEPVGVTFSVEESGISSGTVSNPETLITAGKSLIESGAEALAVVCYFDTPEDDGYANGTGVDIVGGVEAVISHILTREFMVPVAHAPAFDSSSLAISPESVDGRVAAEYITPTFLPCILLGLYNAPRIKPIEDANFEDITYKDVKALVMPYDCLGGVPVLCAVSNEIPVIAVKSNTTVLNVTPSQLALEEKVIEAASYSEAAGYILALREGISLDTLSR